MGFLQILTQIFTLACIVMELRRFFDFFLGARENPQNFNRGLELQNIEENEKYFTRVVFDRFPPKKSPKQLKIKSRPKM